jgi:hypothetical protein
MRTAFAVVAAVLLATAAVAQNKPDFTGSWKLNAEKSDPAPEMGSGGTRAGAGRGVGGGMGPAGKVFATQLGDKLMLDQKTGERSRTLTFYLDGRESRNPGMRDGEMVSKARWEGESLVIEGSMSFEGPNGRITITTGEVRTLSDDGRTMTVVTTVTTPRGESTRKAVYDKQ